MHQGLTYGIGPVKVAIPEKINNVTNTTISGLFLVTTAGNANYSYTTQNGTQPYFSYLPVAYTHIYTFEASVPIN